MSIIAKPSNVLIVFGVLKGYIKRPYIFFLGMVLTLGKFKRSISKDFPRDFIKSNIIIAWIYIRLQKLMSKEKAFEVTRVAILTAGLAQQQAGLKCVEEERTFSNLVKNQKLMKENGVTKLNTMEIIEDNERIYKFKVTRCLFLEFFIHLGIPELTKIFCSIDNAIFSTYLPNKVVFFRNGINDTMADGARECSFIIENKEE